MGSTRLPNKVLKEICNKPVLWHVVSRVSQATLIQKVVVATTTETGDDAIEEFCIREKILVYRGSKNDVLDRYYQAACLCKADHIVRITADCPLHDPAIIDRVIKIYLERGYSYGSNTFEYTYPDGLDVEVFSFGVLEDAWKNANLESDREHVTPYIRNSDEVRKVNIRSPCPIPLYRLTLDTPEDFIFITKIFEGIEKTSFSFDEVIEFLKNNPDLLCINKNFGINEGYIKSLVADAKNAILVTDRFFLRNITVNDVSDEYLRWLNDPEVNCYLETKKTTIPELKQFIAERQFSPTCVFFGIFERKTNRHIGNVKLEPIDFTTRETMLGILIGNKQWWNKGVCTEVIKAVVQYAFEKTRLNSIRLGVISENKSAIACYKKAGFHIEKEEPLTGVNTDGERYKLVMSIHNTGNKVNYDTVI